MGNYEPRLPRAGEIWTTTETMDLPTEVLGRRPVLRIHPGDPIVVLDLIEMSGPICDLRVLVMEEVHEIYVNLSNIMPIGGHRVQVQSSQAEGHRPQADRDFPSTPWI
jgi:hypothetical protein